MSEIFAYAPIKQLSAVEILDLAKDIKDIALYLQVLAFQVSFLNPGSSEIIKEIQTKTNEIMTRYKDIN